MATLQLNPFNGHFPFLAGSRKLRRRTNSLKIAASRLRNLDTGSTPPQREQQQVNLSVLRFTLGIPGLDESNLPRWIGYGFGSLLLLNHFLNSDLITTPAQLRTEALGLALAAFSTVLPYLGKFLKGAMQMDQTSLPQNSTQIFIMSEGMSDTQKENLAWATYILLQNTNAVAVLVSLQGTVCVRGCWNVPDDVLKSQVLYWLERQIDWSAYSDLKDTLYFPKPADCKVWDILPGWTRSLLVQPVQQTQRKSTFDMGKNEGFFLLASSLSYAYSDKDQAWIRAVANKFADGLLPSSGDA